LEASIIWHDPICPYVGLQPYTEDDREYFFGRERQRDVISSNLYAAPLTVLYGASGVGKSSVLRAAVIPKLRSEPRTAVVYFNRWQEPQFLTNLKRDCLASVERATGKSIAVDVDKPFDTFLDILDQEFQGAILILLDQFEEYFLYHPQAKNEPFDVELAAAVNRGPSEIAFLIVLRDDWLSRLDRFQDRIPHLLSNTLRLEHLNREMAEDAIRKPLDVYNRRSGIADIVTIDDGLVDAVLDQTRAGNLTLNEQLGSGQVRTEHSSEGIETAYLQLVMTRLWEA
jgi:hypothetical protein